MGMAMYTLRHRMTDMLRSSGSMMLIAANCAMMVLVNLAGWLMQAAGWGDSAELVGLVALPGELSVLVTRPWTLLTYMWVNADLLHLLFNMTWLYCFGRVLELPLSTSRLCSLYAAGGVAGGFTYVAGAWMGWWPAGLLIGPSAAIIALVVACAILLPQIEMNLLILGRVRLGWVAVCVIVIYMLDIDGANPGGNAAHVGGLVCGALWALARRFDRMDPGAKFAFRFGQARRRHQDERARRSGQYEARYGGRPSDRTGNSADRIDPASHERLNQLLDKVKRGGYGALSADEKNELFNLAHKIK